MNAYQKVKAKLDELGIEFDAVSYTHLVFCLIIQLFLALR